MRMGSPPKDPRVRKDRTCYVCGKPLTDLSLNHNDPFCSTPCARKYHGTELGVPATTS